MAFLLPADLKRAQLGLAHSYSRAKVKFNVNKVDNMIIQAIALLDTLDKDVNTFVMRVREWYSWHFPELVKVGGWAGGQEGGVWGGGAEKCGLPFLWSWKCELAFASPMAYGQPYGWEGGQM